MTTTAIRRPRTLTEMKQANADAMARREAALARADASGTLWTAVAALWPNEARFLIVQGRLTAAEADSMIDMTHSGHHGTVTLHPIKGDADDCIEDARTKIKVESYHFNKIERPNRAIKKGN